MNIRALMIGALILGCVAAAAWFYHQGGAAEELDNAEQENTELAKLLLRQHELQEQLRRQEAEFAGAVAIIDAKYQKELADAEKRSNGFIDDVMSGRLRLWDPHARCGRPSSVPGATSSSASVDTGTSGAELSEEVERFLELEAERADKVAIRLAACQSVVRSDRVINQRRSDGQH